MNNEEPRHLKSLGKLPKTIAGLFKDSKFLSSLRDGAHAIHEVDFDGTIILMRLLTVREQRDVGVCARQRWLAIPENMRLPITNFQFEILETLKRALDIQEQGQRVGDDELETLLESQFLNLYHIYEDLEARYNISLDYILEDDRYEELINELQKKKITTNNISRYELDAVSRRLLLETEELMDRLRMLSSVKPTTTI